MKLELSKEEKIEKVEKEESFTEDFNELPPSDIVAYNELRSCSDLARMFGEGRLIIQPEFQRELVWPSSQQARFVDSLIKQMPIPSLCFSLDFNTQQWLVIDGLQRMSTIIRFLGEKEWRIKEADDIDPKISGKTNLEIRANDPVLFSRLANLTIPITVLRCELNKKSHSSYLFTIFHRLNTGGLKLSNQEIRNAIYSGPFNNLLKACNGRSEWRELLGLKKERHYRYRKIELILRIFALYSSSHKYNGKLAKFLNDFMGENRNMPTSKCRDLEGIFDQTLALLARTTDAVGAFRNEPHAVIEALFVGVAKNLDLLSTQPREAVLRKIETVRKLDDFSEVNLASDISSKEKVLGRLTRASEVFAG